MTIKDWIYLGITIGSYLIALIAGIYTHNKAKINRATRAGQVMDILGQLADNAVHETEYLGGTDKEKREMASEIISQGLKWFGIKDVTPNVIYGAQERAVNAMHLANQDLGAEEPVPETDEIGFKKDVPADQVLTPTVPATEGDGNGK